MPRENRKRGKKHKKPAAPERDYFPVPDHAPDAHQPGSEAGPSWIVHDPDDNVNPEAPFGYVEPDVKAYFRTVDTTIRAWQAQGRPRADDEGETDPNEDRRMFFMAALAELRGKERQLATDPDGSTILERMVYSMDDFVRRVFLDTLAGSYEQLVKHRFASHVVQTLLTAARDTAAREAKGITPSASATEESGELRSLTELVLAICQELTPSLSTLIMDPFASHVLRALLLLLSPTLSDTSSTTAPDHLGSRSRKSEVFRARLGALQKSVVADATDERPGSSAVGIAMPPMFEDAARKLVARVREDLDANEVRAMVTDKAASPVLRLLLELESSQNRANEPDSLLDRVTVGLVSACLAHPSSDTNTLPQPSDFLGALFRDTTSSHVLESVVSASPPTVFRAIFDLYIRGNLHRLAVHPVSNFVVAKAVARLDGEALGMFCAEMGGGKDKGKDDGNDKGKGAGGGSWEKVVKVGRTGVLRAVVDRAAALGECEEVAVAAVFAAFGAEGEEDRMLIVPSVLCIKPVEEYKVLAAAAEQEHAQTEAEAKKDDDPSTPARPNPHAQSARPNRPKDAPPDPLEPTVQGALLVQSALHLPPPHLTPILASLLALPSAALLPLAHHPAASRIFDALLTAPRVPPSARRRFLLSLLGSYHRLVDDRIGSRVGDRCWLAADPYLKEKIGRSLLDHEAFLAGSWYGRWFAKGLNLHLLRRRPEEWKTVQARKTAEMRVGADAARGSGANGSAPQGVGAGAGVEADAASATASRKRKRKALVEDEIDAVFNAAFGSNNKKTKRGALPAPEVPTPETDLSTKAKDMGLDGVFGAIRAAPKGKEGGKHEEKEKKKTR